MLKLMKGADEPPVRCIGSEADAPHIATLSVKQSDMQGMRQGHSASTVHAGITTRPAEVCFGCHPQGHNCPSSPHFPSMICIASRLTERAGQVRVVLHADIYSRSGVAMPSKPSPDRSVSAVSRHNSTRRARSPEVAALSTGLDS